MYYLVLEEHTCCELHLGCYLSTSNRKNSEMGQVPQFRSAGLIRAQIINLWLHGSAEIFLHIPMENSSSAHSQYTTTIQNMLCGRQLCRATGSCSELISRRMPYTMVLGGWRDSRCIFGLRCFQHKMSLSPWPQCRSKSTCISAVASFPVAAMKGPDINKTRERCLFSKVHRSRPAERDREGREAWSNWSSSVHGQKTAMNTCTPTVGSLVLFYTV